MNAARRLLSLRASSSALFLAGGTLPSSTRIQPLWRAQRTMKGREEGRPSVESSIQSNPKVHQMQQVVDSDATGGWEKCWEQGLTPWDLGQPTPIIVHLNRIGALPKGRVLVPGCGSGHDVVAMASPERHIVGLDVSERAVNKAIELSSASLHINNITFLKADFFSWHSDGLFDLIFDYTFFCAIEREMRPSWARKIKDLLKPDGELITLMFPIGDHVGGPPYKVSVAEYEEMLHPLGFKAIVLMDNEMAVGPRKGREKLARWKRSPTRSFL